jgi:hypothetical protein
MAPHADHHTRPEATALQLLLTLWFHNTVDVFGDRLAGAFLRDSSGHRRYLAALKNTG